MIVVDANTLVRAVLDKRMKSLLETYAGREARLFTPEVAFHDIQKSLPEILAKRSKSGGDLSVCRLHGRDEDDWPVLPTALGLRCPIRTEDADFFGTGVAGTTNRMEIFLRR
jgi:predicted nucleic acid-binding protein